MNDKQVYANLNQTTTTLQATMVQAQAGVTDFRENMEALKHNFLLSGYFKKRGYVDSGDLAANRISGLPQGTPLKVFDFSAKELFDSRDSAKMKNQKPSQGRRQLPCGESFWSCSRCCFYRHEWRRAEGTCAFRSQGHGYT